MADTKVLTLQIEIKGLTEAQRLLGEIKAILEKMSEPTSVHYYYPCPSPVPNDWHWECSWTSVT